MNSQEEAESDLKRPVKELLYEIYEFSRRMTTPGHRELNSVHAMGKFSAILIQLSGRAETQSARLITLTLTLKWLTIVLIVIAGVDILLRIFGR
jgi:hypothetical protein